MALFPAVACMCQAGLHLWLELSCPGERDGGDIDPHKTTKVEMVNGLMLDEIRSLQPAVDVLYL